MSNLRYRANWKSEGLALVFGMLVTLMIFGDAMPIQWVGNLDTVFGLRWWPAMDLIYPLASIIVFLLYGRSKGVIRLNFRSVLYFLILLVGLALMQFDDAFALFQHPITLPNTYWTIARWLYFILAPSSFLLFGLECEKSKTRASQEEDQAG